MPGYCLGRAFWGQGYATEALQATTDYFFQTSGIQELWATHATANPASGRVMQKIGFVFTHTGCYHRLNGQEIPSLYYRLTPALKGL